MSARRMDRWWTILIAFLVAVGMVLLVILAMLAGPNDSAPRRLGPARLHHTTGAVTE